MKLTISSQWDNDFLLECKKNNVVEVYGSFRQAVVGSARPAVVLPEIKIPEAKDHISLAHSMGIEFSYVMNAPCLGNVEYDIQGRRELYKYLETIQEIGADSITLAVPILIEMVKKEFPDLKVKVSEIANINSAQRAQYYENLGVDVITLEIAINRDFRVLNSIRHTVSDDIDLEVVVNAACLFQCPYHDYHNNIVAHTGQSNHPLKGYYMDYCMMRCIPQTLTKPSEILKARWIRPEDIHYYEEIGINRFKISNRVGPMHLGEYALKSYANRSCEDLGKLLTPMSLNINKPDIERLVGFDEEEWEQVVEIWNIRPPRMIIKNKKLDGFLEYFINGNCYGQCDRGGCSYCSEKAADIISIEREKAVEYADLVSKLIDPLLSLSSQLELDGDKLLPEAQRAFEILLGTVPDIFKDNAGKVINEKISEHYKKEYKPIGKETVIKIFEEQTPEMFKEQLSEMIQTLT